MTVTTEVDAEALLVRQHIEGTLSVAELGMHIDRIIADPQVTEEFGTLSYVGDLSNALDEDERALFADHLRRLGTHGPRKCAVVCKRALNVATTRFFLETADLDPLRMRAFDNETEALEWLRGS